MKHNHYIIMFFIMIISGLLSTMNVWVDSYEDIRYSINDFYMILLMTGWMFLFMGLYEQEMNIAIIGLMIVIVNILCIRTQFMVSTEQYIYGMIPHHSMAIHMSKQLMKKSRKLEEFLSNIINTQAKEIEFMKKF